MDKKRLFFGMQIKAPWPESLPSGRILDVEHRHLTLAFLGMTEIEKVHQALSGFPCPNLKVGLAGKFDQCLFLPKREPRVVAWHVKWLEDSSPIMQLYEAMCSWLKENAINMDTRHPFNPHVTLARSPFHKQEWEKQFLQLPCITHDICLYESLGNSKYKSLWNCPLQPPFEELEHTADIAFFVYGENFDRLLCHAQAAIAFEHPAILPYLSKKTGLASIDEVIDELNHVIYISDREIGVPFKAVSFHSDLEKKEDFMQWEMIIDV